MYDINRVHPSMQLDIENQVSSKPVVLDRLSLKKRHERQEQVKTHISCKVRNPASYLFDFALGGFFFILRFKRQVPNSFACA